MISFEYGNGAQLGTLKRIYPKKCAGLKFASGITLSLGRTHEVMGNASDMFAVLAAAQMSGPVVWIGLQRDVASLTPTALQQFLDPARLIVTEAMTRAECLWAAEQAMRMRGAACVITELDSGPDLRESRRLQIAAEQGGCLGLLLISGRAQTSAAQTRWVCNALSEADALWNWHLTKNKAGHVGAWRVKVGGRGHAPGTVHLAAAATA